MRCAAQVLQHEQDAVERGRGLISSLEQSLRERTDDVNLKEDEICDLRRNVERLQQVRLERNFNRATQPTELLFAFRRLFAFFSSLFFFFFFRSGVWGLPEEEEEVGMLLHTTNRRVSSRRARS